MDIELAPQHTCLYGSCSVDGTRLSFWVMWCTVIVPSGGPAGKLPGAPTCTGRQDYTGMISSMVFRNSRSHTRKYFSENFPKFRHATLKMFATTVIGRRSLKGIGFNGRQIISLHGAPPCLAPTMCAVNGFLNLFNRLLVKYLWSIYFKCSIWKPRDRLCFSCLNSWNNLCFSCSPADRLNVRLEQSCRPPWYKVFVCEPNEISRYSAIV